MEITTLFAEQKWNIIKSLSKDKFSPLQLAERSDTTIANISQQLRLLEAAELVKKEKIKNRERGKPRTLFSLSNDYVFLVSAMKNFAKKRLLVLSDYHKVILRILFLENTDLHYYLAKFYWKIEEYLDSIKAIIVLPDGNEIKVVIVADKAKEIERKISPVEIKKPNKESKSIKIRGITQDELVKLVKQGKHPFSSVEDLQVIYDPEGIISDLEKQGGNS
ncbi:MAG: winged helix-turn-helix transcriptional regulator [Nanoarchaeota archaeon]|nr:winged helix-turn-helix transcriptional regulator [Nanoarchaeota archaeon]